MIASSTTLASTPARIIYKAQFSRLPPSSARARTHAASSNSGYVCRAILFYESRGLLFSPLLLWAKTRNDMPCTQAFRNESQEYRCVRAWCPRFPRRDRLIVITDMTPLACKQLSYTLCFDASCNHVIVTVAMAIDTVHPRLNMHIGIQHPLVFSLTLIS